MGVFRRRWILAGPAIVLAGLGVLAASSLATTVSVPTRDLPKARLTPGSHLAVGKASICGRSTKTAAIPSGDQARVFARYRLETAAGGYEVDRLIPANLGGSNALKNLWPAYVFDYWGTLRKQRLDGRMHELVCSDQLALASAQKQEAKNWVAAYRKYVDTSPASAATSSTSHTSITFTADPTNTEAPTTTTVAAPPVTTAPTTTTTTTPVASPTDPYDPNGFYASSYGSASTIYCADDSAWENLSPRYLQHFATWAQAIAADPGYHLHQPC